MLRRLLAFLVFGMSVASITAVAVAQDDSEASPSDQSTTEAQTQAPEGAPPAANPPTGKATIAPPPAASEQSETKTEAKSESPIGGWKTEIHGYFRAPMSLGISSRPNPDEYDITGQKKNGPSHLQISYGPNRVMDWSYYSFAYTGLQEQDWAELFIHQKKKHVEAVIGWMGYWYGAAGYRNPDAAWWPGMAYLKLDTDLEVAGIKPNIALTMGSFWPQFGYVEKYDTFTLGRFRMLGEQGTLTLPFTEDLTVKVFQGIGTNRDGSYNFTLNNTNPLYAGKTGVDMIFYGHIQLTYQKLLDIGLHANHTITRDPRLSGEKDPTSGEAYKDARKAHLTVIGGEVTLRAPYLGRLWLSPSYVSVKNGFALAGAGGTEVMHSQNGWGIAENYLAWTGSPRDSTGTGTLLNLGFLYENTLSNIVPDTGIPELKLSIFGLLTRAKLDLPDDTQKTSLENWTGSGLEGATIGIQKKITQVKYGADLSFQALDWLGAMVRFDTVIYNLNPNTGIDYSSVPNGSKLRNLLTSGYIFSALTARLSLYSHYLSGECIFLQYSRYFYGDKMVLAGTWPWNTPMVAGTTVVQAVGYSKAKPDENVIKLQAQVKF